MQSSFRIREWRIDVDRARIVQRDTEVKIDPKMMRVLVYLAEHADDVVLKEKIIEAVWEDTFVTDEVLTNAVWELRKALGDDAKNPEFIQTVPRKGYRLIAPVTWDGRDVPTPEPLEVSSFWRNNLAKVSAAVVLILVCVVAYLVWDKTPLAPTPSFQQLTFRRGKVTSARFSPDGHTVLYSAAWEGGPPELFSTRLDSPNSVALGLPGSTVLATAPGEMAILLAKGTLGRLPIDGGLPREILEGVEDADWSADGTSFAVVQEVEGRYRLEFPRGTVLYESEPIGWIEAPRISPRGDAVAFVDHAWVDTGGTVSVVDLAGNKKTLSEHWNEIGGLWQEFGGVEWHPDGTEIWFTVREEGGRAWGLRAVTLAGEERLVHVAPSLLTLHDISDDGRVLLTQAHMRAEVFGVGDGETIERDFTWLDGTTCPIRSADGQNTIFTESGEAGGSQASVYIRRTDGSPAIRLGDGMALDISPDGSWVLTLRDDLILLATGPGKSKTLPRGSISEYAWALWLPDGERILIVGNEADKPTRLFVQDVSGGNPKPITPEGTITHWDVGSNTISPDGLFVAAMTGSWSEWRENKYLLYPTNGGEPRPIPGGEAGERPWRWSADGHYLFIREGGASSMPVQISRLDLRNGKKEPWKELGPADPAGVSFIPWVSLTPDGHSYTYQYFRYISDLYLAEELK